MTYIKNRQFKTSNGNEYEIVITEYGLTKEVSSAIDTVRNSEGIKQKMNRNKTLKFIAS